MANFSKRRVPVHIRNVFWRDGRWHEVSRAEPHYKEGREETLSAIEN